MRTDSEDAPKVKMFQGKHAPTVEAGQQKCDKQTDTLIDNPEGVAPVRLSTCFLKYQSLFAEE